MQFTINKPKKVTACAPKLYTAELVVAEAFQNLVEQGEVCRTLTDIVDDIHDVTVAVNKHGLEGLKVLGTMTHGSLETFIGAESMADAKLASASLEGSFGDAMKNAWAAIKEWFARFYDWIRKMFFSFEADIKHLEGICAAANDGKFNPNTKYDDPFPTKLAMFSLLKAYALGAEVQAKVMDDYVAVAKELSTIDLSKLAQGDEETLGKITAVLAPVGEKVEKIMAEAQAKLESDPIFKEMGVKAEEVGAAADKGPIEFLQKINANFLKSGSAADLGYKSGQDVRDVVGEFAKVLRTRIAAEPKEKELTSLMSGIADKQLQAVEKAGVPKDFINIARKIMAGSNKLQNMETKILRWTLVFVTRAVRRMYNNAPSNSVAPAANPANPAEPAK